MTCITKPRPREPETLGFPAWILSQAELIRSGGSDAAAWLADHLELIGRRAEFVGATSPAQYDDRVEVLESGR